PEQRPRRRRAVVLHRRREARVGERGHEPQDGIEEEPCPLGLRRVDPEAAGCGIREAGGEGARGARQGARPGVPGGRAGAGGGPRGGGEGSGGTACSVGRKSVTSPADGLTVPTKAIARSGQKEVTPAKPRPVATIKPAAPSSTARRRKRWPRRPTTRVSTADPSNVAVTMALIFVALNPSRPR